jgi:hypothetical protein
MAITWIPVVSLVIIVLLLGALFGYATGAGITWLTVTLSLVIVLSLAGWCIFYCWWLPRKRRRARAAVGSDGGVKATLASPIPPMPPYVPYQSQA